MNSSFKKTALIFVIIIAIIFAISLFTHFNSVHSSVETVSERVLVPCGHSIGIKMDVKGLLIVGLEEIETKHSIVNPAYDSGLRVGDKIISIDGKIVSSPSEVENYLNYNGKKIIIEYMRNEEVSKCVLQPALSIADNKYKIGIWVKERIAGLGTLTYYDPTNNTFACLGHGIYESKTGQLLNLKEGELFSTNISSVKSGTSVSPGEIRGVFVNEMKPIGKLSLNSQEGIFGKTTDAFSNIKMDAPMVIGKASNIKKNQAFIMTTLSDNRIKRYEILITGLNHNSKESTKGIEFKVVDKELLKASGGIVQGMSGSPIIQNERIIGAVTHVLLNDPTIGYGIFIERMVEKME